MADIEPPSFSLGLDFDFETPHLQNPSQSPNQNDDSRWRVSDSDCDSPDHSEAPSRFRRLRRGGPRVLTRIKDLAPLNTPASVDDDDIEDFSSEENVRTDHHPPALHRSIGSSSKFRLSGSGILTGPGESALHNKKRKQDSSCPSTSVASNKGKSVISELTSSPLRMFQLLDSQSDSDVQPQGVQIKGSAGGIDLSKINKQGKYLHESNKIDCEEKIDKSSSVPQKQDLWKDFYVEKSSSVPTPVFDEFYQEYFEGGKQHKPVPGPHEFCSSGIGSSIDNVNNLIQTEDLGSSALPCHRYFFHNDLRIQRLVRSRLPFFSPLNSLGDTGNKTDNASSIDYKSQFGNGDGAKQKPGRKCNSGKSSKRSGKKNKKSNSEDNSQSGGPWINPKETTRTPTDAGKRRVVANGQSAGQWFVGENGRKVYVTKTGEELSGRPAYIRYKKDSGGFSKSRKKGARARKKE